MKWITNAFRSDAARDVKELCLGSPGRRIKVSKPKATRKCTVAELVTYEVVGLYDMEEGET